jgi:hypothetical protein
VTPFPETHERALQRIPLDLDASTTRRSAVGRAALSGDLQDIDKADARVKRLILDNPHLHNGLGMAQERMARERMSRRVARAAHALEEADRRQSPACPSLGKCRSESRRPDRYAGGRDRAVLPAFLAGRPDCPIGPSGMA